MERKGNIMRKEALLAIGIAAGIGLTAATMALVRRSEGTATASSTSSDTSSSTYDSGGKDPRKFTTGIKVIPDTYPFPPPKPGDGLAPKQ